MPQQSSRSRRRKGKRFDPRSINDGFRTPDAACSTITDIWVAGRSRMYSLLQKWLVQLQYFKGDQFFDWVEDNRYVYSDDASDLPDDLAFWANLYQGHVMGRLAKMTQFSPRTRCGPTTPDDTDKSRAELWNDVLAWRARVQNMDHKLQQLFMYLELFGNGFLKSTYDPLAGSYRNPIETLGRSDLEMYRKWSEGQLPPEQAAAMAKTGGRRVLRYLEGQADISEFGTTGDVIAEVVPPYEITIADQYPKDQDALSGMLHTRVMRIQELRERYFDHPEINNIRGGLDSFGHQLWFLQQATEDAQSKFIGGGEDTDSRKEKNYPEDDDENAQRDPFETVLVHEWWGRVCPTRPHGIRVVACGNVILEPHPDRWEEEIVNPYLHGQIPLVQVINQTDGINFWGTCPAEQAVPVQDQINQTVTQIIKSRNRTADPIPISEKNNGADWDNISMDTGELIEVNRGCINTIKYLESPNMPPYVERLLSHLEQFMETIFSDQKPSQGRTMAGDSGRKVRFLQQADENRYAPYAKNVESGLRRFWIQQACLIVQYTESTTIGYVEGFSQERSFFDFDRDKLLGQSGVQPELEAFPGFDTLRARIFALRDQMDITVNVVPGKSQQTVTEELGVLMNTGFLQASNPSHQQIVLEMLGWGLEVPKILAERRRQTAMASLENDAFAAEQFVSPPHLYQEHAAHIEAHIKFVDSERFKKLSGFLKQQVMEHIQGHEKLAAFAVIRQQYIMQDALAEAQAQLGPNLLMGGGIPGQEQPGSGPQQGKTGGQSGAGRKVRQPAGANENQGQMAQSA